VDSEGAGAVLIVAVLMVDSSVNEIPPFGFAATGFDGGTDMMCALAIGLGNASWRWCVSQQKGALSQKG
jgi:hypothetical protein